MFFGTTDSYLDNCLSCEKNWTLTSSAIVGLTAGRLADKIRLDCIILKMLCRLNYFDFYFVYGSPMLLIVFEVHFSLLFSNNVYFRVCFVMCKIRSPFFSCWSLLLGKGSVVKPNDWQNYNFECTFPKFQVNVVKFSV